MKQRTIKILSLLLLISSLPLSAQEETKLEHALTSIADTAAEDHQFRYVKGTPVSAISGLSGIVLDREASLKYLQQIYRNKDMWKKSDDPFREALGVLIYNASRPPADTALRFLSRYSYSRIKIPLDNYYVLDSVRIILPFIQADSLTQENVVGPPKAGEMFLEAGDKLEKIELNADAVPVSKNDTLHLSDSVFILMKEVIPLSLPRNTLDTIVLVITDTLPPPVLDTDDLPFKYLRYPLMGDTIEMAVKSLVCYLEKRDSSFIQFVSETGQVTNVWLNSATNNLMRFWLPDGKDDSVTVWIGSPARDRISLQAEEGVLFKKQTWHDRYVDTKVNVTTATEEELRKVELSRIKPQYWKYRADLSYLLSQGMLSNWAKGGESNISTVLDATGYFDYNNKESKISSSTKVRFALGMQASGKEGIRKNSDLIEINSKINHKAFGKFDFSGVLQFRTQSLPGYNYPNDSVKVSKFFNPATLILGYGLDYQPDKNLSISISPLSYKGVLVPDTATINQVKYGVDANKRSKNEMGAYITINSNIKLFEKINMSNRIQLFSNFLSKPQNIDIDWELIATTSLNWFTDLRLNLHLLYDDNVLFPVYDKEDNPVLNPDGTQKKTPKVQFKELLGFSFVFRF